MNSEDKAGVIYAALISIVLVVFIGGCTTTLIRAQDNSRMTQCLDRQREWRDGNCVLRDGAGR